MREAAAQEGLEAGHIYTHSVLAPLGGEPFMGVREMVIGDGATVFANAILVHCRIPPGAHVAAGAVLTKSFEPEPISDCSSLAIPRSSSGADRSYARTARCTHRARVRASDYSFLGLVPLM